MNLIIFAGGIGTRLWPLSRINSPKQFDAIWDNKSTLRLAIERLRPHFAWQNIFVQTVPDYQSLVRSQLPELPAKNIFLEPTRRNVGPAVCLAMRRLEQFGKTEPVAILWADHLMKNPDEFIKNLKLGAQLINEQPQRFVFLAEEPRFANNNLGWIHVGKKTGSFQGTDYFRFLGWRYKPEQRECDQMFQAPDYYWNPGYFISSPGFILSEYQKHSPEIFSIVEKTVAAKNAKQAFEFYGQAPQVSFDNCLIEKTDLHSAVVLKTKMGWSDPGTLYALKEALQESESNNVITGRVFNLNTADSLVYNLEPKKLVATVGLQGLVVVNTKDALIVVPKDQVKEVTELVEALRRDGYKKYL
ncbi:MAG TPA: sugar phosphate nucleotidyltransferase [Patescibacteria group bacterium]|nr:sugar phosphate nucleotidyltransferase [Patescibacteria group bacterium]